MNADSTAQLLCVRVSNNWLGIDVKNIIEITKPTAGITTELEKGAIDGGLSFRDKKIPVVFLAEMVFGQPAKFDGSMRILISEAGSKMAALIVDSVEEIIMIAPESIRGKEQPADEAIAGVLETEERKIYLVSVEKVYQLAHVG
ncbi:MAG: chemotaxis protein CheW [Candidatus Zixiibacteriota bacterium]|nr:MAG: chemotaxis protein CheW [candidate division Zixibacteria bacterium]